MPELDEAVIKRVLPHSIEAEQSVIGAMLLDKEAITVASEQINGEDFYGKQYGILFDAMIELNDEGKPVDLMILQNRLKEKGVPPEIYSLEFITPIFKSQWGRAGCNITVTIRNFAPQAGGPPIYCG